MRVKINKKIRQVVIILLAVLLTGSAVGLLWSQSVPSEKKIEYEDYRYQQEASFDYTVHLLPNEVFSEDVLYPGRAYVTALTDYITVNFEYIFTGEREAEISGNYSVTADLVALIGQNREDQLLWEESYVLIPRQSFAVADKVFSFNETVAIPFAEYLELTEWIQGEIKVSPAAFNLVVRCDVNLVAETGGGIIKENLIPEMIIPLRGATFSVDGNLVDKVVGSLTKTRIEPVLPVRIARTVIPVVAPAVAVFLVFFLMVTSSTEMNFSPEEREVSHLLRLHRMRIIRTTGNLPLIPGKTVAVDSFKDLLRLADEVEKPILYLEVIGEAKSGHFFMVYTPELVYLYQAGNSRTSAAVAGKKKIALPTRDIKPLRFADIVIILLVLIFVFSGLIIAYARY